jgi:hypothetical protein
MVQTWRLFLRSAALVQMRAPATRPVNPQNFETPPVPPTPHHQFPAPGGQKCHAVAGSVGGGRRDAQFSAAALWAFEVGKTLQAWTNMPELTALREEVASCGPSAKGAVGHNTSGVITERQPRKKMASQIRRLKLKACTDDLGF